MYECTCGGNYIQNTPNGVIPVIIVINIPIGKTEKCLLFELLFGILYLNTVIKVHVLARNKNEKKTLGEEIQKIHNKRIILKI